MVLTKLAKSPIVIWTFYLAFLGVSVQTFVPRRAVSILGEPPTLRHTPEVIFMQEFTSVAFLA
jgi:hypothetical protein